MLAYPTPEPARELADATLGMIGGQYLDITGADVDLEELHRLKTGRLFAASVGLALWVAGVPEAEQAPWRAFGEELGLLFQIVDDVLDGDGYAARLGVDAARDLAEEAAARARGALAAIDADTSALLAIVDGLAVRTSSGMSRNVQLESRPPSPAGDGLARLTARSPSGRVCTVSRSRRSRAMPPAGRSSTGICSIDQPRPRAPSKNAAACRRPGSAISASPPAATAACERSRSGKALRSS